MLKINVLSLSLRKTQYWADWQKTHTKISNTERSRRWRQTHVEHARKIEKAYRLANPHVMRNSNRRHKYGPKAPEHLETQIVTQNNCCAICQEPFITEPHLDHNHETKELRGALCGHCNRALGLFKDKLEILIRAVVYRNKYGV